MHDLTEGCEITTRDRDGGMWAIANEDGDAYIQHVPPGEISINAIVIPSDMLDWVRAALGRVGG